MQFNFTYSPNVTLEQIQGFELAGKIWSTYLTDNVTINIAVDTQSDFPGNAIAGATPRLNAQKFDQFQKALQSDVTSSSDRTISQTNNIMAAKNFSGRFDLYDSNGRNTGTSRDSTELNVNSATAKSLDLDLKGSPSLLDGYIVMRDMKNLPVTWSYDFARTSAAPSNTMDFLSVAIHEIGHILGFQSSVDRPGWKNPRSNGSKPDGEYSKDITSRVKSATPLDLFRYSDRSSLNPDKNGDLPIDLAVGGNPYLSIQNGKSPVANFDTGTDVSLGGNGLQASHWKSGGIMNATINRGMRPAVTSADLTALDAIGWDLSSQGTAASIDYARLLAGVKQSLAQKLGQTVAWLDANPTTAASRLTQEVANDVSEMLNNSTVYKKKDTTLWTGEGRGSRWWQGFKQTFLEEGVFESLGDHDHDHSHEDDNLFESLGDHDHDHSHEDDNLSESLGDHDHDHSHEDDNLSGTVDPLTGLPMEGEIATETSSDNGSLMSFEGAQTYDFAVMDLMDEIGLGDLGQSLFDRGILASWANQNLNGLVNSDLFSNSTNEAEQGIIGGNVI
jgi:hypothetical protein